MPADAQPAPPSAAARCPGVRARPGPDPRNDREPRHRRALRWQHADRLDADLIPGAIILRLSPHGRVGVHQDLRVTITATARRSHGIKTGDYVLLAATPAHHLLVILTMRAVDELLIALDAALVAASPAATVYASAIVSPAAARTEP